MERVGGGGRALVCWVLDDREKGEQQVHQGKVIYSTPSGKLVIQYDQNNYLYLDWFFFTRLLGTVSRDL